MRLKILLFLEYMFNLPFYLLSLVVKKDDNIWIFGAWFGEKYSDNSRYLYEYVVNNHKEIKAIWITSNREVQKELEGKNLECYYKYSYKAIKYAVFARVSVFVQSNYVDCLMFMNNKKTLLIQLWHGTPIKKIGNDDKIFSNKEPLPFLKSLRFRFITFLFPYVVNERYDVFIACSEKDKKIFSSAFSQKNVVITGFPRNDGLKHIAKKNNNKRNIIYLPTFRGNIGDEVDLFFKYKFDLDSWVSYLSNSDSILYLKMHPVNIPSEKVKNRLGMSNNIVFLNNEDVSEVLPKMDILISDYSSVFFDYLLTEKPLIFAPFDYDEYVTSEREFYYDYDVVTPGPKCTNWKEVLDWVKKFENAALYAKEREQAKLKFHRYTDFQSSYRVYNEILKLM